MYELAALALGAPGEGASANAVGVRAARLRAIKAGIIANLADGELSVSAVAARYGATPSDLRRCGQSRRSLAASRRTAARGGEGHHGGEE